MVLTARTEFASALNQVCAERGIEPEVVLESIKAAILAAYRKDYGEVDDIDVDLNAATGSVILKKDGRDVTPPGFGRIAAQTAKQVILQRIREAEKTSILSEFEKRVGTIVPAQILRVTGSVVIVNLGKTEGVLPPPEQVPGEKYTPNTRMRFYIKEIRSGPRGEEVIVSRSNGGLVAELFKQAVPEIAQGTVEIKVIAREAGSRTKIAVASDKPGVDPVGSCVGQKGVRVSSVMAEIGDEKIDVIAYDYDLAKFVATSLSPAKEVKVKLSKKGDKAEVSVPADQLSLAIGRNGQNVRLAAKLTGVKIELAGEKTKTASSKSKKGESKLKPA